MNNFNISKHKQHQGLSLVEVLVALVISTLVLTAMLGIYRRVHRSVNAITRKLDSSRLPREVLQRIAEDLDGIITASRDVEITINNKLDHSYPGARLSILKTIHDNNEAKQPFEEIVWQSDYDYDSDTNGLVLYRSHRGMVAEDKLLDRDKQTWERELFVPICAGVTWFQVQAIKDATLRNEWTADLLPPGVKVTISFAEPYKTPQGNLEIPDEQKNIRTIALDRTQKTQVQIIYKSYEDLYKTRAREPNETENTGEPNEYKQQSGEDQNERVNDEQKSP